MSSFTTTLQHNQIGKGGFAVSFYMRLMKRNTHESRSASNRRVRKLLCRQGLLVAHDVYDFITLVLELDSSVNRAATSDSILAGSDNKSLLPLRISIPANTNVQV